MLVFIVCGLYGKNRCSYHPSRPWIIHWRAAWQEYPESPNHWFIDLSLGSRPRIWLSLWRQGLERIIPILSALKPKWRCRRSWVTHTLLLLGKGIKVFILSFPSGKWKFLSFYGTKRNINHVVSSAPNPILTMTYKALHKSGSILSPSLWQ